MRYLTIIFLFIATFATGQQQMFLRSTPAPSGGILDGYTGAAAAYATALLYSSYSGSCLRVRRDSDNTEQDIGFSGQNIDEAAINSFCSGANCFVSEWYDQSGSGNDSAQSTIADQPKIYDSSTGILLRNASAELRPQDASDKMTFPGMPASYATGSFFMVASVSRNSIALTKATSNDYILYAENGSASSFLSVQGFNLYKNASVYSPGTRAVLYSDLDNTQTLVTGIGARTDHMGRIGASNVSMMNMQLLVIFLSDQSTNQAAIESAINNYYNIYP